MLGHPCERAVTVETITYSNEHINKSELLGFFKN